MTPKEEINLIYETLKIGRAGVTTGALRNFLNHWWLNRVRLGMPDFDALKAALPDQGHHLANMSMAHLRQSTLSQYGIIAAPEPEPEPEVDEHALKRRFWERFKASDEALDADEIVKFGEILKASGMNYSDWAEEIGESYAGIVSQAQETTLINEHLIEYGLMPRPVDVTPVEPEPERIVSEADYKLLDALDNWIYRRDK